VEVDEAAKSSFGASKHSTTEYRISVNSDNWLDSTFPDVFKEDSFTTKFVREVKVYHRWFGLVFFYSEQFSRAMRTLSLMTSLFMMLFVNALTYNIAYPDDGTCGTYVTEAECVEDQSSFSDQSKCFWGSGEVDGTMVCSFREPSSALSQVVFVAVISAVFSTPVAVFADYIIMDFIAAPTLQDGGGKSTHGRGSNGMNRRALPTVEDAVHPANSSTDRRRRRGPVLQSSGFSLSNLLPSQGTSDEQRLGTSLQTDMNALLASMRTFRASLSAPDLKSFDGELQSLCLKSLPY
jgi:hypothetical protein